MNVSVDNKHVVIIDDVLYTGRSVRAAIDALMPFGRPRSIELLVLIDRRLSRHLPIQPNYVGKVIDSIDSERVVVSIDEIDGNDKILILKP
jgi:pyrimidine operon attenuation protein/uracil phosphoribosyltransferase